MLSLMPTQAMKPYATKVVVQACSVTEKPIMGNHDIQTQLYWKTKIASSTLALILYCIDQQLRFAQRNR